jgi:hypothetical protein
MRDRCSRLAVSSRFAIKPIAFMCKKGDDDTRKLPQRREDLPEGMWREERERGFSSQVDRHAAVAWIAPKPTER